MIGRNDVGAGGDLLDLALAGVGNAGQEVDEAAGDGLVGLLQIEDHGALIPQMIGDLKNLCDKDEDENKTADDSPSLADQYAFTTPPNHAADAVMKEIRPEKPSDPH